MLPGNDHLAGFGDFSFSSHNSNPVSHFNFDANFNSDPNSTLAKVQFTNQGEADEWGDFASSPNKSATVDHAISSEISRRKIDNGEGLKREDAMDEWGLFVSSSLDTSTSNRNVSNEILGKKLENGGLKVGSTNEQEHDWFFNGTNFTFPVKPSEEKDEWGSPVVSRANDTSTNGSKPTILHEISHENIENVKLHGDPSKTRDISFEEDEWGNFVSSPVASGSKNGTGSNNNGVQFEKPKGPLPLSLFGGEEDESSGDEIKIQSLQNLKSEAPIVSISKIIGNELDQEATIKSSSNISKQEILEEFNFDQVPGVLKQDLDFGEEIWEFKDASLDQKNSSQIQETKMDNWASFSPLNENPIISSSKMKSVHETDQSATGTSGTSESTKKDFILEFYRKLKEGSLFLISRHLRGLNESSKVASFSGQAFAEIKISEKIKETYREIENLKLSKDLTIEDYSSKDSCINDLLNNIENSHLKDFEQEYNLSTKLFLALEELSPAIDLLKHSLVALNALEIAFNADINAYISAWSRIISVCSQELQNGAIIWAESDKENKSNKLISIGENYFTALGEIYRVVQILKITLKYFNCWLLISNPTNSSEIGTLLEICIKSWHSGLSIALEKISNSDSEISIKANSLAKSIKRISEIDFDEIFLGNIEDIYKEKMFCKICLLPLAAFSDIKVVTWSEDKYLVKFANLWANKISTNPPNLPIKQVHFSPK